MPELAGMQVKFTVIKNEDVEKHLDDREKSELSQLLWKIQESRRLEGKVPLNTYLVVNTDEPYAVDVVRILQANGHWGPASDPNQAEMRFKGDELLLPEMEDIIK
ncbi:hypothetical protein [Paenibacillus sp. FSL K6-1230]|uniref:hypothetical protein n=1 Tax=Paenibacillus sp. FSL K6-1230 TaxID=2921603 RepID=UPI0030F6C628